MATYELKNRPIFSNGTDDDISLGDRDALQLQRLGKKPVLKVCVHCDNSTHLKLTMTCARGTLVFFQSLD